MMRRVSVRVEAWVDDHDLVGEIGAIGSVLAIAARDAVNDTTLVAEVIHAATVVRRV